MIERFGSPVYDLAASAQNTKCAHYFTEEQNSLIQAWHTIRALCFLNPPFDHIEPWAKKCMEESKLGLDILFLVPASVGSEWYHNYVHGSAMVYALRGRIPFDPEHPKWGYPKDCILCCYGFKRFGVGFDTWKWRT